MFFLRYVNKCVERKIGIILFFCNTVIDGPDILYESLIKISKLSKKKPSTHILLKSSIVNGGQGMMYVPYTFITTEGNGEIPMILKYLF